MERKVFTELKGPHADELNDALGRIGFRRSHTVAHIVQSRADILRDDFLMLQHHRAFGSHARRWLRNYDACLACGRRG